MAMPSPPFPHPTEGLVVFVLDLLVGRLVGLLVDGDHDEVGEELGAHARLGEQARAREDLLTCTWTRRLTCISSPQTTTTALTLRIPAAATADAPRIHE